jgi:hypothetical protein
VKKKSGGMKSMGKGSKKGMVVGPATQVKSVACKGK